MKIFTFALAFSLLAVCNCKFRFPKLRSTVVDESDQSTTPHPVYQPNNVIHYEKEVHLKNVKQLTFGGENAEAYFSFDNKKLIFQSTASVSGGFDTKCDQIFEYEYTKEGAVPWLVSTGLGTTTCSYFFPDSKQKLYASTHEFNESCVPNLCTPYNEETNETINEVCHTSIYNYTWDIHPQFDIYKTNEQGVIIAKLTNESGYDAEATVSPTFNKIVYTSMASGDLDLWTMNLDGTDKRQMTNGFGYDGGAYFSPDGTTLALRASRFNNTEDEETYYKLLHDWNIVSPVFMELYTVPADGSMNETKITNLGQANWAPYWHPSGKKLIFASNWKSTGGFAFTLWMVDLDGNYPKTEAKQITFDPVFDSFPMFSFDGKYLVWCSARNATSDDDFNIFIAEWVENPDKASSTSISLVGLILSLFIGRIVA